MDCFAFKLYQQWFKLLDFQSQPAVIKMKIKADKVDAKQTKDCVKCDRNTLLKMVKKSCGKEGKN